MQQNIKMNLFGTSILLLVLRTAYSTTHLPNGYKILHLYGTTTTIDVEYSDENVDDLSLVIMADTNISISGTINTLHKNGTLTISPPSTTALEFGTYKMEVVTKSNKTEIDNVQTIMLYEQTMTGLTVPNSVINTLVNTNTSLSVTLSTGSGSVIEWIRADTTIVTYSSCNGVVNILNEDMSFETAETHNVTVLVVNTLDQTWKGEISVHVWKPVEGLYLTVTPVVSSVNQIVSILVKLDNIDRIPMGVLYYNVSYGDGQITPDIQYTSTSFNELTLQHSYMKQGNFEFIIYVYSNLSYQSLNTTVLVWNDIVLPQAIDVIEVYKTGLFPASYLSVNPFHYFISYGDNTTKSSPHDIVTANLPINGTEWDTAYFMAGVYKIDMEGWNDYYTTKCQHIVKVQNPVPQIQLIPKEETPLQLFPANYDLNINLSMSNPTDLPPTNMTCIFCFEVNACSLSMNVDFSNQTWVSVEHSYNIANIKDVTVTCSNEVSSKTAQTRFEVLPGIEGIRVTNGYDLYLNNSGSTTTTFSYDNGIQLTSRFKIYSNPYTYISGSVNESDKTGNVTITGSDIESLEYGIYKVALELISSSGERGAVSLALFYEEPITGFAGTEENLLLRRTDTFFTVSFTSGSNTEIEVVTKDVESILVSCEGIVSPVEILYQYEMAINYNVTYIARNAISGAVDENHEVMVVKPVKGFNITTGKHLIDSYTKAVVIVTLDDRARLPMHDLTLFLDFGDSIHTGSLRFDSTMIESALSDEGYIVEHTYTKQGNYTITGNMSSVLSTLSLATDIYIWDNLENVSFIYAHSAKVGETVQFYFDNVTRCGFEYFIEYGENNNVVSSTPGVLNFDYVHRVFEYSYSSPYVFEIHVVVWNSVYSKSMTFYIIIQHPIVDFYLTPRPPIQYPIPDGEVVFKIEMTQLHPDPTNVTCRFIYENGEVGTNTSVNITYDSPDIRSHDYTTNGTKAVDIYCSNVVSNVTLTTVIDVKAVELVDFTFIYPLVVPMNMTKNASDVPVQVSFHIELFECVRFPPEVKFLWNFGDKTNEELDKSNAMSHIYENRDVYSFTITITNSTHNATKTFKIKIGAVDYNVSSILGGVHITSFTFSMIGIKGEYQLNPGTNAGPVISQTTADRTEVVKLFKVYDYGKFSPEIKAVDETFTEFLYFKDLIVVDYNVSVLEVSMPSSVKMPIPGDVNVTASLVGTNVPLPYMTCTYDMQDFINYTVVHSTQNITADEPLIFNFRYLTLGKHDVTVNCSNLYDKYEKKAVIEVTNKCFTIDGIFDRQYARPTNPMKAYTTENFDLINRMGVHCNNETITFYWKIYKVDVNGKRLAEMNNGSNPDNRGSYRFAKGKFPEGLYEVFLNVSLTTTWIPERTYIEFVRSDPKAFIEGGFERTSKLSNQMLQLDALTSSYDVALGYGHNQNLTFTWTCYETIAADLDDLSFKYSLNTYDKTACLLVETSRGIANLTFHNSQTMGYIVQVNVSLETVFALYTQLIMTDIGFGPDVYIRCKLNCNIKYALSIKSIWEAACMDCEGLVQYKWSLRIHNGTNWVNMDQVETNTGLTKPALDIKKNSLEPGRRYILTLTVTDSNGVGTARWEFLTNLPPYGGICKATNNSVVGRPPTADDIIEEENITGKAFSTKFAVYCFNFKDEGEREQRDETEDNKFDKPLMYEYIIKQYDREGLENERSTETSVYKGGESTATELRLPAGNHIGLYVKVIDRFGDYAKQSWTIHVSVNESLETKDIKGTQTLFEEYDKIRDVTKSGGNTVAVLRLISSVASMYSNSSLANDTDSTPVVGEETDINEKIQTSDEDDLKTTIQKKTREFVKEIASLVPENSSLVVLPSAAQLVASTMDEVISNPDAISQNASEGITNTTYEILKNIHKMLNITPLPMQELEAMIGGAQDSVDVISKNLNYLIMDSSLEDLNVTLTYAQVEADLQEDIYYGNVDPDQYPINSENIEKSYQERLKRRNEQIEKANSTERTTKKFLDSIDQINDVSAVRVASGQGIPNEQETDQLYLSVEKDTVESITNKSSIKRKEFTFNFQNSTFGNVSEGNIELQVSVLNKSPIIHANGASKIRGKIVKFVAKLAAIDDDEEDTELALPLEMAIENEKVPDFKEYEAESFSDEPNGFMHFKTKLQDEQDAIIIYYKPKDMNEENQSQFNITVRATSQVTSTVGAHEYEAQVLPEMWTQFGFKVVIPGGTLPEGNVIVSFKALQVNSTEPITGLSRRRRSVSTPSSNYTITNVTVGIITTGCKVYDESSNSWTSKGCTILPTSTINETHCSCEAGTGTVFSASFFKPNMIDFHSVFNNFDPSNAAVYGTLIALFVLYFIGLVVLRRYDKADQMKWMPLLLCDNQKSEDYFYLISVFTGIRPGSGTTSNISFILGGEDGDSGVRLLSDGQTSGLESKTVKSFIMGTSQPLGGLTYMKIWHDNSGDGENASWYLHKIVVDDLQNNERFIFLCDQWLALDLDDGMIERMLPVLDKDNSGFESVFSQEARVNVTDNHLWLSIIVRPQRSLFTRIQRLSCLMSLLLLSMITNAMFFTSSGDEEIIADSVRIGKLHLSLRTLYISFVGILITIPPIFLMTYLFKNTKVKKSISNEKDDADKENSDEIVVVEEARFPHWCIYIAWATVALSVLVPAFFLILYSMQWGKDKSEEWLTTFVLSFIESLFIVDPIKVVVIALIIAWLIRKPVEDFRLSVDLNSVKDKSQTVSEKDTNQFLSFRMAIMSKSGPPVEDVLQMKRQQRLKEKIAQRAFIDVVLQILFAIVVFSISYVNRDTRSYQLKSNIFNHLYEHNKYKVGFREVTNGDHFLNWTKGTLVPFMFPTEQYNGIPLDFYGRRYVSDLDNTRVGLIRLRQVRSQNDTCIYSALTKEKGCIPEYSSSNEADNIMSNKGPVSLTTGAWQHTSSSDVWGISIMGVYNSYEGGGYIQNLADSKDGSINIVNELIQNSWIDRQTRAVFVEFTLFNPNINTYVYSIFLAEFSELGGVLHWADTQSFRASTITDATGVFALIFYFIFLIIIMVLTFRIIQKFRHEGCLITITNFWNVLDITLCSLSYTGAIVWVCKFVTTKMALNKFNDDKNAFVNFQHIVVVEYMFTCILGGLCFTATLRILNALKYNRKLTEVAEVLRKGAKPMLQFSVMFSCVFLNFVGFGYLLFGTTVHEYRNLFVSFGSLTNTLIGRNSLDSMIKAAPAFAELYFFVYVFFVIFTLMTVFAAILNESISEVRYNKQEDTIGIIQIVKTVVKDVLSLAGIHMKTNTSSKTIEKYKLRNTKKSIDASNVLELIRETLDDFKPEEENPNEKDDFRKAEIGNLNSHWKDKASKTEKPKAAKSVTIVLPDGKEEFYDFYKGYI